jgi:hypothetical protein
MHTSHGHCDVFLVQAGCTKPRPRRNRTMFIGERRWTAACLCLASLPPSASSRCFAQAIGWYVLSLCGFGWGCGCGCACSGIVTGSLTIAILLAPELRQRNPRRESGGSAGHRAHRGGPLCLHHHARLAAIARAGHERNECSCSS